jgi:hypothetical protein
MVLIYSPALLLCTLTSTLPAPCFTTRGRWYEGVHMKDPWWYMCAIIGFWGTCVVRGSTLGNPQAPQAKRGKGVLALAPRAGKGEAKGRNGASVLASQAPTSSYKLLQAPTSSYKLLQAPTSSYKLLQAPTSSYKLPQAPTSSHKLLQVPSPAPLLAMHRHVVPSKVTRGLQ